MSPRKSSWPNDIEELIDMFYNPKRYGDRKRYEDAVLSQVLSPAREEQIQKMFSSVGNVKKIERGKQKTFDFLIDEGKLLLEVTSLNIQSQDGFQVSFPTREKFADKISKAIWHGDEKVAPEGCEGYFKIIVILYDSLYMGLGPEYIRLLFDKDFIKNETEFLLSKMDAVLFVPENAYIMSFPTGEVSYQPIAYIKSQELVPILENVKNLKIVVLD